MPKPKKSQSSLTSFFGAAPPGGAAKRKGPKQTRLDVFTKKQVRAAFRDDDGKKKNGKGDHAAEDGRSAEAKKEEKSVRGDDVVVTASSEDSGEAEKGGGRSGRDESGDAGGKVKGTKPTRREKSRKKDDEKDDLMDTESEDDGDNDGNSMCDEHPLSSLGGGGHGGEKRARKRNALKSIRDRKREGKKSRLSEEDEFEDEEDGGDCEDEGSTEGLSSRKRVRDEEAPEGNCKGKIEDTKIGDCDDGEDEDFEPKPNEDDDDLHYDEEDEDPKPKKLMVKKAPQSQLEKKSRRVVDEKKIPKDERKSSVAKNASDVDEDQTKGDRDCKSTLDPEEGKRSLVDALKKAPKAKAKSTSSAPSKKSESFAASQPSDKELLSADSNPWKTGDSVPYEALCATLSAIEAISGRLEIQRIMTDLFRKVLLRTPDDLLGLTYLSSNSVAPAYECIELGVGDSILIKAIGEASGTNPSMVKQKYEKDGDLGTVAGTAKGKQRTLGFGMKPKPLMAKEVLSVFRQIATTTGSQSQKWKVDKIKGLLVKAGKNGLEAKYIIRGLQGKLRIGLAQSTVLISLAHAFALSPPEKVKGRADFNSDEDDWPDDARKLCNPKLPLDAKLECAANIVKKAYSEVPSYKCLIDAALKVPLQGLHKACTLTPGVPVAPMLAKPTKSIQEVLKRLNGQRFTCEYKYDGERAQVHMLQDGTTKVFSRNLLDTTEKFPEVPEYVKEACRETGVSGFVLDTEVVAWNNETGQFVPFQVLSTRKKTEESPETAKVSVIVQAFDLMYLNGKSLLDKTLSERRDILRQNFKPVEGKFQFATSLDHTEDGDTAVLEDFLDRAVKGQCEGLMVKTLDDNAAYEPSRRSLNWLKLKKDYLEGLGDSVDLVPLGAYWGKGKRVGVYGAYLLACYDPDTEEYQSVCKIGTGFSDDDLKTLSDQLNEHKIPDKTSQYNVSDSLECDVWFDAVHVWEVKAADLSKSSTHRGAAGKTGEAGRGIGLRFPRFERIRNDKKPDQATSSDQILEMYYAQDSVVDGGGAFDDDGI